MKAIHKAASTAIFLTLLVGSTAQAAVTFPFLTIGDVGNPNDTNTGGLLGGVTSAYQISATNVTDAQYTEFLNLVDPTGANALSLYNPNMATNTISGGITFSAGAANGFKYAVKVGFDDKPVNYVSFLDSMRFVNWLSNGQGSGDTETGAYTLTLGGLAPRNSGAAFFLPSENQWYKAAYYDPTKGAANNYYLYGTRSDTLPTASAPTANPNSANYASVVGGVTDVGAYSGSASHYGAFDMAGNVLDWNEAVIGGTSRGLRGGSWNGNPSGLDSSSSANGDPTLAEESYIGFRVATVPEPTSAILLLCGASMLLRRRSFRTPAEPIN
jgi:formylglycine-generating enzyme